MLNKVIIMGRMTSDIEIKEVEETTTEIGHFTIAVDRDYKNDDGEHDTDFIRCVAFNNTADFIDDYFGKGRMIAVVGRLKTGRYTKDNVTHFTTDVIVDSVSFTGEKSTDDDNKSVRRTRR